ncbi:hypothetical protein Goshw_010230 [Gossypium schwendimanii]|uniref:Uncharacterized protein n=1 Tax=Gossypium schwendimanii TaxID=34291 RepID=A0A7J9NE36_GOSSC|nr:hypothetical protein [Gossypium schwendimanii]
MKNNFTRSLKYNNGSCKKNPSNIVDTSEGQLFLPRKRVERGESESFNLEI